MSDIPAKLVKQLRDKTGVGFIRCKNALAASAGDLDKAIEWLRQKGEGVAAGKSDRAAAEGLLVWRKDADGIALLEVNCETDSVARLDDFQKFSKQLLDTILSKKPADVDALLAETIDGSSFEKIRQEMIGRIGENIQVRRFLLVSDNSDFCHIYVHGGRIAGFVKIDTDNESLGHDLAMQVVASQPSFISISDIPEKLRNSEKEIIAAGLADSPKPEEIKTRIIEGKLNKQLGEMVLEQQSFLKDNQITVKDLLQKHKSKITEMHLWRCGEGVDKPVADFASEVEQQAAQSQLAQAG